MAEKEILFSLTKKDFDIDWYSGTGAGGQNRNKVQTACRITHIKTGLTAGCQEERTREANKKRAFIKLTSMPKFKTWLSLEIARAEGKLADVDEQVKKAMAPTNLKIEVHDEKGRWVEATEDELD